MAASEVMTIRIDPQLLRALRRRAKRAGRSVSAEVIQLIRKEVQPVTPGLRRKTMGMFPGESFDLDDYRQFRRELAAKVSRRLRRYE